MKDRVRRRGRESGMPRQDLRVQEPAAKAGIFSARPLIAPESMARLARHAYQRSEMANTDLSRFTLLTRITLLRDHSSRKPAVTGMRAARKAGNRPPTKPIASAHLRPLHSSSGDTLKENTT